MPYRSSEQGIFAPAYYRDFHCIADRCRHSCCIDWEIGIDEATLEKYRPIKAIMDTVTVCEDGPCFALTEDGRCPHLNARGLCDIILTHGEDYLADICRLHPRFFNDVGEGRTEAGLGLVCEEACRLILTCDRPFSLVKIGEAKDAAEGDPAYDPLPERDRILVGIDAAGAGYAELYAVLRDAYGIPAIHTPDEWIDRFLNLEILDKSWARDLQAVKNAPSRLCGGDTEPYWGRLLAYFVYRHVSVAVTPADLRARLGFCLLSVDMIRFLFEKDAEQTPERLFDLARRYSAEIEYSEDNTDELIFAFACAL